MKLADCVDITYRDGSFILQPRTKNEIDLVLLGFDGTEKWIRLQCVEHHTGLATGEFTYTATICRHDSDTWSWQWGWGGYTLISEGVQQKQNKIVEACKEWCVRTGINFPGRGW